MSTTPDDGDLLSNSGRFEYTALDGALVLHPGQRTLTIDGTTHNLAPLVMRCACLLLYRPRQTVALAKVLDRDGEQSVTNAVSKLRALLRPHEKLLQTVRGAGYLWEGDVRRRRLASADSGQVSPAVRHLEGGVRLDSEIGAHNGIAVWRGTLADDTPVVVKFAQAPAAERRVEREHTLWRLVDSAYPEHPQMLQPVRADFEGVPKYFACPDAGQDLDLWLAAHGAQLDRPARFALFQQILDAVSLLHRLGITHRDLKPSNLFVAGPAEAPVLTIGDLGSAQIDDRQRFEQANVRPIGLTIAEPGGATPLYAAPELLRGESGTSASDLYALGVILYQLIRGDFNVPFTGDWAERIDDPALRELIVDMTHSDEAARIASIEVARDRLRTLTVRRQEIEDLAALQKVRARRPWLAAGLALTVLLGVIGYRLVITSELARVEQARKEQMVQFVSTLLESGDPTKEEFGPSPTLQEALHRASAQLDQGQPQDPVVRLSLATVLASVYAGLGDTDYSVRESRRQLELARTLWEEPSVEIASRQLRLGSILARSGDPDAALTVVDAVREPERLDDAAAQDLEVRRCIALAEIATAKVDYPSALTHFERALDVLADEEGLSQLRLDLEIGYAGMLARTGKIPEALARAEVLKTHSELRNAQLRVKRITFQALHAQLLGMAGQPQEAITLLETIIPETQEIYGKRSTRLARLLSVLGQQQANQGDYANAADAYGRAIALYCREDGGHPLWCQLLSGNLGAIQVYLQQPEEALRIMDDVRTALQASDSANPTSVAVINFFSANAHLDLQQIEQAAALAETLTVEHLEQAAPGAAWALRLQVLNARIALHRGPDRAQQALLDAGLDELRALGFKEIEVAAFGRVARS
ncbi:MAG: protein kinase [Pseudomonadota bacterium]